MKKNLFAILMIYAVTLLQAHGLVVEVTQGNVNPIPVALTPFKAADPASQKMADDILALVEKDLSSTGLFKVIPQKDFIEDPNKMDVVPRFADWRLLETQGLTTGKVLAGDQPGFANVEFRLWDVFMERQIEGQLLGGPKANWRKIAHKISNYIYKRLIGEEGHFDTRVAYVSESAPYTKNNKRRLAVVDFDGENHRYLTGEETIVLSPRLSPTKPELVFMSYQDVVPQVFQLNLQTGKRQKLGNFPGMTYAPRYSPDGKKVVFSLSQNGLSSIHEMDLTTRKTKQLTKSPAIDTSPGYSPDGSKIVFNSDRSGTKQLYVMDSDGKNIKRISFGEGRYATPVWSPRGDLIAFSKTFKGNFYIGVMRPDGSGERWISSGYVVEEPTWSPNGRLLMFAKQTKGNQRNPGGGSYVIVADVTGKWESPLRLPKHGSAPDWSTVKTFS